MKYDNDYAILLFIAVNKAIDYSDDKLLEAVLWELSSVLGWQFPEDLLCEWHDTKPELYKEIFDCLYP